MLVLVTGATGLIGQRLVRRLLDQGDQVRALSRQPLRALELKKAGARIIGGDITQPRTLGHALQEVEVVYHVAGLVGVGNLWPAFTLANVTGVANMLAAARTAGARRFVHVSSVAAYDRPHGATTEDAPVGPGRRRGGYGASKARGDLLAQAAMGTPGLEVVIARPVVVFDAGRDPTDARYWVRRARRLPLVPLPAGGALTLDLVHAADVAQLLALCGALPLAVGRAYNASGGDRLTLRAMVHPAGQRGPAILPLPGRRGEATFPADRATAELGYAPEHHWADPES